MEVAPSQTGSPSCRGGETGPWGVPLPSPTPLSKASGARLSGRRLSAAWGEGTPDLVAAVGLARPFPAPVPLPLQHPHSFLQLSNSYTSLKTPERYPLLGSSSQGRGWRWTHPLS